MDIQKRRGRRGKRDTGSASCQLERSRRVSLDLMAPNKGSPNPAPIQVVRPRSREGFDPKPVVLDENGDLFLSLARQIVRGDVMVCSEVGREDRKLLQTFERHEDPQ